MKQIRASLLLIITLCLSVVIPVSYGQDTAVQSVRHTEQMVEMRDGVKLATSVYLPEGNGPWPVVLIRTPYGKDTQAIGNGTWTKRGFALVTQDCR
jgi:predicted acyl esterase